MTASEHESTADEMRVAAARTILLGVKRDLTTARARLRRDSVGEVAALELVEELLLEVTTFLGPRRTT
jgi:hypothetical protein